METITNLSIICSCLSVAVLVLCTYLVCSLCNRKENSLKTNAEVEREIERINNINNEIDKATCLMINEIFKELDKECLNDSRKRNTERN
jgi:hypothetical protein